MKLVHSSLLIAFASSVLVAAAPPSPNPGPAKIEAVSSERLDLARRFVGLTITQQKAADSFRGFEMEAATRYATAFYDEGDDAGIREAVYRVLPKLEPILQAQMPQLLDAYAQAYAREYSADELKAMVAFAGSPAGKHLLSQLNVPDSDWGIVAAQQRVANSLVPTLQEMEQEPCAKRAAARIAMGDAKAKCPLSEPETQAG